MKRDVIGEFGFEGFEQKAAELLAGRAAEPFPPPDGPDGVFAAVALLYLPSIAIVDRREAIERAIREARVGDLVVIAGKGHEKYQVIGDRTLAFDDVAVAREALGRRRTNSGVR